MTTTQSIVKISSPEDLIGAIPAIVGFHPSESLVVVCFKGESKRQDLSIRHDLVPPELERECAYSIVERARARKADGVAIVCYTEAANDGGDLPRRALVDQTICELSRNGIGFLHLLLVRSGRWWSYDPDEMTPPDGVELPVEPTGAAAQFHASAALRGRVVMRDREELERTVRGPVALREIELDQRYQRALAELAAERESSENQAVRLRTLELADSLLATFETGGTDVSDRDACRMLVGLTDAVARDALVSWALDDDVRQPMLGMLTVLCQRALDDDAAPICTALALVAYMDGNGALGNVAVDRALRSDPGYALARMVYAALQSPIDPKAIRSIYSRVTGEWPRPSECASSD